MSSALGKEIRRFDSDEKVRGQAVFAADVHLSGELHAKFLPSPHAHAEILTIRTAEAEALPGVVAVVTAADIPDSPRYDPGSRLHAFMARRFVVFQGQPVAAVAAVDLPTAEAALALIEVEYRLLPVVATLSDALAPDAVSVAKDERLEAISGAGHTQLVGVSGDKAEDEKAQANVASKIIFRHGDVEAAFEQSDLIVENMYMVPVVHQGYIEPHAVVARWDTEDRVTVWECVQGAFAARDLIAHTLNIPHANITVNTTEIGGGFGGKIEGLFTPIAVLLAKKAKRPVRLVVTRTEEFLASNPAPASRVYIKSGAKKDGTLTGLQAEVQLDTGAFPSGWIMNAVTFGLRNTYNFPAWHLTSMEVLTNKASAGSYRAPGAPNASFAIESQIDELAYQLGIDPLEFRRRNLLHEGDLLATKEPQVKTGAKHLLDAFEENASWPPEHMAYVSEDGWLHGYGLALGGWDGGNGPASAVMTLDAGGRFGVLLGTVDLTGTFTGMAQIAAEALGVSAERIVVRKGSPGVAPFAPMSAGSQTIYATGAAVLEAACDLKAKMYAHAAATLETTPDAVGNTDEHVYRLDDPSATVSFEQLFELGSEWFATGGPLIGVGSAEQRDRAPGYSAAVVHIAVEPTTGLVKLLDLTLAQDVGKAINPHLIRGQMHGGAVQSVGFALWEEVLYTEQARVRNASLLDYRLPTFADIPNIQTIIVEAPGGNGPYGAKIAGEPSIITPLAAIANAVRVAVGVRFTEMPITPERVWQAMQKTH